MNEEGKYIRALIHALRGPLTAILSNIEFLRREYEKNLNKEIKETLDDITSDIKYMEILLKNASDVVKLKKKEDIILQEVDLSEIIKRVKQQIEVFMPECKEFVNIEFKNVPVFHTNRSIIERYFYTLMFELLKFCSSDNKLNLIISAEEKEIVITLQLKKEEGYPVEKIFKELFFSPAQPHSRMNFIFFEKVLFLFNGKKKLVTSDPQNVKLIITFPVKLL